MEDELYFKRQQRLRGEFPDTYQYTVFPREFRIQICHILSDVFLDPKHLDMNNVRDNREDFNGDFSRLLKNTFKESERIYKLFLREKGRLSLKSESNSVSNKLEYQALLEFICTEVNADDFLTIVELIFTVIENQTSKLEFANRRDSNEIAKHAIAELNQRFREHGVGYQYENGQIIRVDSEFVHTEAVKLALQLLSNPIYKGAQEEFLKAHEHYRHQRYSEALIECLKAYESTLKIILDKNKWEYSPNAAADELTSRIMQSGLVPEFWQQHFRSLKNTLTSGVPTARNKMAGHGAGNEVREIPEYLVSYILHMTASTIVFLVKADEALD